MKCVDEIIIRLQFVAVPEVESGSCTGCDFRYKNSQFCNGFNQLMAEFDQPTCFENSIIFKLKEVGSV